MSQNCSLGVGLHNTPNINKKNIIKIIYVFQIGLSLLNLELINLVPNPSTIRLVKIITNQINDSTKLYN